MDYRLTAELACHKLFRQIIVLCSFQIITIKVLIAYKQLILLQEYKCIAGWAGSCYYRALFVGELGRALLGEGGHALLAIGLQEIKDIR